MTSVKPLSGASAYQDLCQAFSCSLITRSSISVTNRRAHTQSTVPNDDSRNGPRPPPRRDGRPNHHNMNRAPFSPRGGGRGRFGRGGRNYDNMNGRGFPGRGRFDDMNGRGFPGRGRGRGPRMPPPPGRGFRPNGRGNMNQRPFQGQRPHPHMNQNNRRPPPRHIQNRPFNQHPPNSNNNMHMQNGMNQYQQPPPQSQHAGPSHIPPPMSAPPQQMINNQMMPMQTIPQQQMPFQTQPFQQNSVLPQQIIAGAQVAPLNPAAEARNWSTHKSPDGVDYYYNSATGVSTYTRPSCLAPNYTAVSATVTTSTVNASQKRKWTQHLDKNSGRTYYYDGTTTTWEKPSDLDDNDEGEHEASEAPTKKIKKNEEKKSLYGSKAEATAAFKGLLLAKDITPGMSFAEVTKICSSDKRWEACSSTGEKKQALAEFQTKRANELKEEKRQEKIRARDAFMKLLTDKLPSVSEFNANNKTPFQEIREYLVKDDRFHAVEDESEREEMYHDFIEEIRKRDERQKRNKKRDAKDSFLAFLKAKEELGALTFASTWHSFVSALGEDEKTHKDFIVSPHMSDQNRQLYFADYVIGLQVAEDEKRRRIREARKRSEKAQRDAFRDTLTALARDGKIFPSSRWRNVEEILVGKESYAPVKEQGRNEPQNLFEDFVDEWNDIYHGDKAFLSDMMGKAKESIVTLDTKYDQFTKNLLDSVAHSPDLYSDVRKIIQDDNPVSSARILYDEIIAARKAAKSRGRPAYGDSSEDEGEIVEDGEITDE
ncbi:hypothetical protein CTEN210_08690 [Chaetoceros tenuissimus]|uniref:Uncharacterized protein n=1 Tax=Chaetoceros tenuissimus TaxID=426638 RepID=A0AAD3CX49_9STRA|nr:hypothetical protein CTEN210_08690 [Chaetoceros tenuissimus]